MPGKEWGHTGAVLQSRGSTPIYKPCRYVPPQRVWFLRRFCLKTGLDFAYFGLESGMVFSRELRFKSKFK